MNTRSTRSRAKRDEAPAAVEIIDVSPPKKKTQDPEIITLEEEEPKVKSEVQCLDDDVITLEDDDVIMCEEEEKTTSGPGSTKEPPAIVSKKVEPQPRLETRIMTRQQQKAVTLPTSPRVRTIEVRQVEQRGGVRDIKYVDMSQPDKVLTRRQKVKQEPPQVKVEPSPPVTSSVDPCAASVVVPKPEPAPPDTDNTPAVVVKTQPPEPEAESRITTVVNDRNTADDEEVETGPEHVRKLFIGRVGTRTTHDSLKQYFEKWGKIVDIFLPTDRFTKKSRGFAFITFAKAGVVDDVQKARPHTVDGRIVDPKRAVPRWESHLPQAKITVKTVFLHGLRGQFTEQELKEYFNSFGKVIGCRIIQQKGIGFVEFDDYDPVDKIFLQKVHRICGKSVGAEKAMGKQNTGGTSRNWNQRFNGYQPQRWTGVNPRGSQYSRRTQPYAEANSWQRYNTWGDYNNWRQQNYGYNGYNGYNGYQNHMGGGPVRNYYTRRYTPYSNQANWSSNQRMGYSSGSVVFNWSTSRWSASSSQRNVSNNLRGADSSQWGSRGYSSFNFSNANTSGTGNRSRLLSGLFAFPVSGTMQSYNYSTLRR